MNGENQMKKISILSLLLLTTGCAVDNVITSANGVTSHKISCGIAAPEACNSKAAEICPNGYNTIQTEAGNFLGGVPKTITVSCKVGNDNQIENSDNKSSGDMYTELKRLKELSDLKIITQEEFDTQKKAILDKYK